MSNWQPRCESLRPLRWGCVSVSGLLRISRVFPLFSFLAGRSSTTRRIVPAGSWSADPPPNSPVHVRQNSGRVLNHPSPWRLASRKARCPAPRWRAPVWPVSWDSGGYASPWAGKCRKRLRPCRLPDPFAVGAGGVVHEIVSRLFGFTLPAAPAVPLPGLSQGVSRPDSPGINGLGEEYRHC